jgi:hypothetical protein
VILCHRCHSERQEVAARNPDEGQSAAGDVRLADAVPEMVERRTDPGDQRIDSHVRTDAGAPHDASDRAPVPAGLHLAAAARARAERAVVPRAEGPAQGGADVLQLALPRRGQPPVEGEVSAGGDRRDTKEEVFPEVARHADVAVEGRLHAAARDRDELAEQADPVAQDAEGARRPRHHLSAVLRQQDSERLRRQHPQGVVRHHGQGEHAAAPHARPSHDAVSVPAHPGGAHGRRLVVADVRRDDHQRQHGPDPEGVGRRNGQLHTHLERAHVDGALHASARQQVSR